MPNVTRFAFKWSQSSRFVLLNWIYSSTFRVTASLSTCLAFLQVLVPPFGCFLSFCLALLWPWRPLQGDFTFTSTQSDWMHCCLIRSCCGSCWSANTSSRLLLCCSSLLSPTGRIGVHLKFRPPQLWGCRSGLQRDEFILSSVVLPRGNEAELFEVPPSLWFTAVTLCTETLLRGSASCLLLSDNHSQ